MTVSQKIWSVHAAGYKDVWPLVLLFHELTEPLPFKSVTGKFYHLARYDEKNLFKKMKNEKHVILMSRDGKRPAGLLFAQYHEQGIHKFVLRINWLAVHTDYRGSGLSDALVNRAENYANFQDIGRMECCLNPDDQFAVAAFERIRFKKDGRVMREDGELYERYTRPAVLTGK